MVAKYFELGQVVSQVIGSTVLDLSKYASAEAASTHKESLRIPLKYRGFTNNVATLKVAVKSQWLKNLSASSLEDAEDNLSEISVTQGSDASTSNYQTPMTHLPPQQERTPPTAQAQAARHGDVSAMAAGGAAQMGGLGGRAADNLGMDDLGHLREENRRLRRENEEARDVVKTCEGAMDAMVDDFAKLNFEIDGKVDEIFLHAEASEKKVETVRRKLAQVSALRAERAVAVTASAATDADHQSELKKARDQIEFLKNECGISSQKVTSLKKALQEKEEEIGRQKELLAGRAEETASTDDRDFESAEEEFESGRSNLSRDSMQQMQQSMREAALEEKKRSDEAWSTKVSALVRELEEERRMKESADESLAESLAKAGALAATIETLTRERDEARTAVVETPAPAETEDRVAALQLQARVDELESELQFLRLAQEKPADAADTEQLQRELESKTAELKDLETAALESSSQMDEIKEKVSLLEQREAELLQETDTLKSASSGTEALQGTISDLEVQLESKTAELKDLETAAAESSSKMDEMRAKVSSLAMRESELLQETDTLKSASSGTETLQARVSSLEQRESELLQEVEALKSEEKSRIKVSEEKPVHEKDTHELLAQLVKEKTSLQEENCFLIGELTEAKIELAEIKMATR